MIKYTGQTQTVELDALRADAARRSFGVADSERRACVRHGYLLALEDVERQLGGVPCDSTTSSRASRE